MLIFQHRFRAGVSTLCVGACDPQSVGNGGSFLAGAKRRRNFLALPNVCSIPGAGRKKHKGPLDYMLSVVQGARIFLCLYVEQLPEIPVEFLGGCGGLLHDLDSATFSHGRHVPGDIIESLD